MLVMEQLLTPVIRKDFMVVLKGPSGLFYKNESEFTMVSVQYLVQLNGSIMLMSERIYHVSQRLYHVDVSTDLSCCVLTALSC